MAVFSAGTHRSTASPVGLAPFILSPLDLVAYFSATGTTAGVAKNLAEAAGADLYEIRPKTPYTSADLDWDNPKFRPPIEGALPDVSGYDTVLVGFPIWWYVAPTIINTFLEGCNLSGKRVAVFATSGGSGMGRTLDELKPSAPGAVWLSGKRFGNRESVSSLKAWIEGL